MPDPQPGSASGVLNRFPHSKSLIDDHVLVSASRIASSSSFCLIPAAPWYLSNSGIIAEMIAVPITHNMPPETIEVLTLKSVATIPASASPNFGPEV
jgi:hypothetical protein